MRAARTFALTVVAAAMLVAPLGGIAAAGGPGGGNGNGNGNKTEVLATLKVENPNVEVKAKGADDFEPATDGQQLRQGDTVRTDATGRAEVDYSENSYTRLDVNTTFKIVKLTESQGQRQVEGGLESGRTWNRAEAVTESGTFDQSGGGATAAVTGTAFPVECSSSTEECIFTGVVGTYILKGNGEDKTIEPFDQCDSISGELCDEVTVLTVEEMAAIAWIQENLLRDLLERGLGPGPFVIGGTLVIEQGQISFQETTSTTAATTTTQPPTAPVIDDPPISCELSPPPTFGDNTCDYAADIDALANVRQIAVVDGDTVLFTVRVLNDGGGGPVSVVFTEIPDGSEDGVPFLGDWCENTGSPCGGGDYLERGVEYPINTVFRFDAQLCECYDDEGVLSFHVKNSVGSSPTTDVPVIVDGYCSECSYSFTSDVTTDAPETSSSAPTTTPSTPTTSSNGPGGGRGDQRPQEG